MHDEDIPYFVDKVNKFVDGAPIVERHIVNSVIYDPKTDRILCMKWNNFDWKTFVNGGIDDGEDNLSAALREIQEETGYKNLKFICELGKVKSAFYTDYKKENRIAHATGMLFELVSDAKDEVEEYEKAKHLTEWVPKDKVAEFINIDWQLYLWDRALESEYFNS